MTTVVFYWFCGECYSTICGQFLQDEEGKCTTPTDNLSSEDSSEEVNS